METIQFIVTIDIKGIDDTTLAEAVNKIYEFAVRVIPGAMERMDSLVRVSFKRISRNEQQEGEVKP